MPISAFKKYFPQKLIFIIIIKYKRVFFSIYKGTKIA